MSAVVRLPEEPNEQKRQEALTEAYLQQLREEHERLTATAVVEATLKVLIVLAGGWGLWSVWQILS